MPTETFVLRMPNSLPSPSGEESGESIGSFDAKQDAILELTCDNYSLRHENELLRLEIARLNDCMRLIYQDPLTRLWNRRYFDKRINEEIFRAQRHADQVFSILFIDVNSFKEVNDRHGHVKGDEILKWVARLLEDSTRLQDICCRLSGDEFIIILGNTDEESCQLLVERLRKRLAAANRWLDIPVGLSMGTATFQKDGTTIESLFQCADAAMYRDKRRQKNKCLAAL